jgi:hypothetical protein
VGPLERWLPDFDVREHHERDVDGAPEHVLESLLAIPAAPDVTVRTLFRVRGLGARSEPLGRFFDSEFVLLDRTPTSLVVGTIGGGRGRGLEPPADSGRWLAFARPGSVKIALEAHAEDLGGGRSRLVTETRVRALDEQARRSFRRYWLFVGPFSALIRRRWLRAAAIAAASRPAAPSP